MDSVELMTLSPRSFSVGAAGAIVSNVNVAVPAGLVLPAWSVWVAETVNGPSTAGSSGPVKLTDQLPDASTVAVFTAKVVCAFAELEPVGISTVIVDPGSPVPVMSIPAAASAALITPSPPNAATEGATGADVSIVTA